MSLVMHKAFNIFQTCISFIKKVNTKQRLCTILFQEVKKWGKCIAETEQCPAYSVQDGYKHARQFHTCISKYLQTL